MRQLKLQTAITNRDSEAVEKYFQDISKIGLISPDEEVILAVKIKQGDPDALEKMVKANLRFVVSVAKQYQNQGLSLIDLINWGNIWLIKAAKRFDETRGFKFISYAVRWIRQSILYALAHQWRMVRLPQNKVGDIGKINKATAKMMQDDWREPTVEELAQVLDMDIEDLKNIQNANTRTVSFDAPFKENEEYGLYNIVANTEVRETDAGDKMREEEVNKKRAQVFQIIGSPKKIAIMCLFFGFDWIKILKTEQITALQEKHPALKFEDEAMTLESIGEIFDLTLERVRQIKDKGIRALQNSPTALKLLSRQFLKDRSPLPEETEEPENFDITTAESSPSKTNLIGTGTKIELGKTLHISTAVITPGTVVHVKKDESIDRGNLVSSKKNRKRIRKEKKVASVPRVKKERIPVKSHKQQLKERAEELIKTIIAEIDFPLEETIEVLQNIIKPHCLHLLIREPVVFTTSKKINSNDVKGIQLQFIRELQLAKEYHEPACLFFGAPHKKEIEALQNSKEYDHMLWIMQHIHNYMRYIYKIELTRFAPQP